MLTKTTKFLKEMANAKTRTEKWDFLYSTEYQNDSIELNDAMASMTDEQLEEWFIEVCSEHLINTILKTENVA